MTYRSSIPEDVLEILEGELRESDAACLRDYILRVTAENAALREKYAQADGMAECMAMLRDDCIRAGVFSKDVPPMFYSEAVIGLAQERDALARRIADASASPRCRDRLRPLPPQRSKP